MSIPVCFSSIVGFSRKADLCVTDEWLDIYSESESGLYVDELPGFPQRFIASLGGNYDIWEKMTNSMDNAIRAFKIDVVSEILKLNEPVRERFKGDIGCRTFDNTITSCTYQGLRFYSDITGGVYNLRGFYLILNVTEVVTLEIYDEYDLLYSYSINATANRPVYTAITPISLSLDRNYYFLYTTSGSAYDNKLDCNCGGWRWCFNTYNPCFGTSRLKWTEWAMVGGVCGEVLADRDDWATSSQAKGLVLHGDFNCDIIGSLCDDYSDFSGNNEIATAMANAIWYKTGAFLSVYVLDSEEVSRRTLLGTEQWVANKEFYEAKYREMIELIATHWEADQECLKCRDPHGFDLTSQIL
jgi:hypothetical protein